MTTMIAVDLAGTKAMVLGGDPAASRAADAFVADGADVTVVAESLCEDLVDLVAQGRAKWLREEPGPSHIGGAGIVHAGTGDHSLDQQIAWSCRTRGVLCLTAPGVGSAHLPVSAPVNGLQVAVLGPPEQAQETASAIATVVAAGMVDLRAHAPAGGRVTLVGAVRAPTT